MYYRDKLATLKDIFATDAVALSSDRLTVGEKTYPVIDDVVILTDPSQYTEFVRRRLGQGTANGEASKEFAEEIQYSFGEEWKEYGAILPEHEKEFRQYFDIVDAAALAGKRVCDLGCGMGRWSYFLKDRAREIVLVDFSDAIFVARKNLSGAGNCLFFMGDLKQLPFRDDFAGLLFSLGVLHHLPTPCLDEVRKLKRFSPQLLVFLYYALDNRPWYFKSILSAVTAVRTSVCSVRNALFRKAFSIAVTVGVYVPLVLLGRLLAPFGWGSKVPLYDFYRAKTLKRIEQDVYDRFFTSIEQRVSRKEILSLTDTFSRVRVSENLPFWHFLCER